MMNWLNVNILWILLALATFISFLWLKKFQNRLDMKWYVSLIIAILHTVTGVLCVKVFAFLESFGSAAKGSMSLFGGIFFMPCLYFVGAKLFKRKLSDVFDILTVPMVFTLFCARINCLFNGCCLGIQISANSAARVPTRQIELLFYFILLNVLVVLIDKDQLKGRAYPLFMMSYGILRFVIEFFRESEYIYGVFHISHLWAVLSFMIGLSVYLILSKKNGKMMNGTNN